MFKVLLIFFLPFRTGVLHRICCCKCLISQHHENVYSWFKQSLGEAPTCILSLYAETSTPTFYGDFKNDKKLSVLKRGNIFALTIKDAKPSDTGIYYCGARDYDLITFSCGKKITMNNEHLNNEKCKSSYDPFNPGDSVNLHCSVLTKKCVGNHSVYWFKHESGDTHPGIIYKHGNMNDQCEKTSEKDSHVQSFIYNLPKKNLGLSDAGTYYCAVVTCGEILFGNGSRLEIGGEKNAHDRSNHILIAVSTNILWLVIIAILLCKRVQKRQETFSGKSFPYQEYSLMTRDFCYLNLHYIEMFLFSKRFYPNRLTNEGNRSNQNQQKSNDIQVLY
uniref:Novel immune-type receptor 12 n=1 Tax=Sinocyclocheilus grahami TaxID=75366 RepID=A0A672QWP8_SINGR